MSLIQNLLQSSVLFIFQSSMKNKGDLARNFSTMTEK